MAAVALCCAGFILWSEKHETHLVGAFQVSLLCWFLLLPTAYPWYAVGLLAVSALRPRPWVVVLSGAFGMYYLIFLYDYRDYPAYWELWTRGVEHGLVWLSILIPSGARVLRIIHRR